MHCRPEDEEWYAGTVSKYDDKERKHLISYDDDDEEWLKLSSERHQLLPPGNLSEGKMHGELEQPRLLFVTFAHREIL
jgi:hypothetical protein